jgi:TetR/AcrR family transcriptional regulator, transcriptional repressor for nem operon
MPKQKFFNEDVVLQKALNLFWQKGYEATSMQDLVDTLEISRSSLYDTFVDKYTLYVKCMEIYKANNVESLAKKVKNYTKNPLQFIKEIFQKVIQNIAADKQRKGCYLLNTSSEFGITDKTITKIVHTNNEEFIKLFEQLINQAIVLKQLPKNTNAATLGLILYANMCSIQVLSKAKHSVLELSIIANFALANIGEIID